MPSLLLCYFLPWQREFLRRFEAALKAVDPSVNLPWWPWDGGVASITSGLAALLPGAGTGPVVRVSHMIDYRSLGFDYDEDKGLLQVNESKSASIDSAGESHSYAFNVTVAAEFSFATTGSTDVVMSLLREDGSRIIQDDDSGTDLNARIDANLGQGRYYVGVRHYSGDATGPYGIRVLQH